MAHYALLNQNNEVIRVITGVDENIIQTDADGSHVGGSTKAWEDFYVNQPWLEAVLCKRTSYNGKIRKNYAGIGYTYDEVRDAFIPPKCHDEAVLVESTCLWDCDNEAHTAII